MKPKGCWLMDDTLQDLLDLLADLADNSSNPLEPYASLSALSTDGEYEYRTPEWSSGLDYVDSAEVMWGW